jgi:hypothetical protein
VSVLLGNGDGTFAPYVSYTATGADHLTVADIDGDGTVDLVTAGAVLIGKGDGTFGAADEFPGTGAIAVADLNGDGHADIVTSAASPSTGADTHAAVDIFLRQGDGTVLRHPGEVVDEVGAGGIGQSICDMAAADFNGDGVADLATVDDSGLSIAFGNGHCGLAAGFDVSNVGGAWTDFNGRVLDITSRAVGATDVRVRCDSDRTWTAWQPYATNVAWDLNGAAPETSVLVEYRDVYGDTIDLPATVMVDSIWPATTSSVWKAAWYNTAQTVQLYASGFGPLVGTFYKIDAATKWSAGTQIPVAAPSNHSDDGMHTLTYYTADWVGHVGSTGSCQVGIDTTRPTPMVPASTRVVRGRRLQLRCKVSDVKGVPITAKLVFKNARGKVVRTVPFPGKTANTWLTAKFRCTLAKGSYRLLMTAVDAAGNAQSRIASGRLSVT